MVWDPWNTHSILLAYYMLSTAKGVHCGSEDSHCFCILLLAVFFIICRETVSVAWREAFTNATNSHFLCEAVGHVPGRCSRETFERYSYVFSILNCVYYFLSVFVPVVNLVFVIKCRSLQDRVRNFLKNRRIN